MAKKNDIKTFITDLKRVQKNIPTVCEKGMDEYVRLVLGKIAEYTAYDTGTTRDVIAKIITDELKIVGVPYFIHAMEGRYEYWRKSYGKRDVNETDYTFQKDKKGNYKISIIGDGFYNQAEEGVVSESHPRQDPYVFPRHVDKAIDLIMAGKDSVYIPEDEIINAMIEAIETGRLVKPKEEIYYD